MTDKYLAILFPLLFCTCSLLAQTEGSLACGGSYMIFENRTVSHYADVAVVANGGVVRYKDVCVENQEDIDAVLRDIHSVMQSDATASSVIVSGDVSATKLSDQLRGMSISLPQRISASEDETSTGEDGTSGAGKYRRAIVLDLPSPRVPDSEMTLSRAISMRILSDEFCDAACRRIRRSFDEAGLPLTNISVRYSGRSDADESYTFILAVPRQSRDSAQALFDSVIASVYKNGFTLEELEEARTKGLSQARHESLRSTSNADNINLGLGRVLYSTPIYTPVQFYEAYRKRGFVTQKERSLTNAFVKALIPDSYGTIDTCTSPRQIADSLYLAIPDSHVKVVKETSDKSVGGRLWRFANGMAVSFSTVKGTGEFSYAMILPASGLQLSPAETDILETNGMTMSVVNESGRTILNGYASSDRLKDLMGFVLHLQQRGGIASLYKAGLILCGDLDESKTRKTLSTVLGNYNTAPGNGIIFRPEIYRIPSIDVAYMEDDHTSSSFSAEFFSNTPYTPKSYYALSVLATMLEYNLDDSLRQIRWQSEITPVIITRPSEMFCLSVKCAPVRQFGRSDQLARTADRLLSETIEAVLSDFDKDAFKRSKALLKYSRDFGRTKADGVVEDALIRFSDGKDIFSGAGGIIDSIAPEDVMDLLSSMYATPTIKRIEQ